MGTCRLEAGVTVAIQKQTQQVESTVTLAGVPKGFLTNNPFA